MNNELEKTFIIHSRAFKETSLLLSVFSENNGRFNLIAKGVKRKNSQGLRAILQPFNALNIEFTGRGDLKTLCYAELFRTEISLENNNAKQHKLPARALACGYYLNELLMRSLQDWEAFPRLFESYQYSLQDLCQSDHYSNILRKFEVVLLEELGVSPTWDIDIQGEEICEEYHYRFIPEEGFELVKKKVNLTFKETNENHFTGQTILSLGCGIILPETIKSSQKITQMLLCQIIGDKPLQSRKLWI